MPSKRLVFIVAFVIPIVGFVIIPFAVMYGRLDKGWMSLSNGIVYLTAAILVAGAVSGVLWMVHHNSRKFLFRGDYPRALQWARLLGPTGRHYRAAILCIAGRFQEAEEIYRRLNAKAHTPKARADALDSLGEVLTCQGRYEEAKLYLDEAIRLEPDQGGACHDLAVWYLEQNLDPQAALVLIEQALSAQAGPARPFRLASKAWALARLSFPVEARTAIDDAFRSADPLYLPGLASLHLYAGRACVAMSEIEGARQHFQQAARLDATGHSGATASRLLQSQVT